MILDFTALLAPAAVIMAALVVLPAALIAAEAITRLTASGPLDHTPKAVD